MDIICFTCTHILCFRSQNQEIEYQQNKVKNYNSSWIQYYKFFGLSYSTWTLIVSQNHSPQKSSKFPVAFNLNISFPGLQIRNHPVTTGHCEVASRICYFNSRFKVFLCNFCSFWLYFFLILMILANFLDRKLFLLKEQCFCIEMSLQINFLPSITYICWCSIVL